MDNMMDNLITDRLLKNHPLYQALLNIYNYLADEDQSFIESGKPLDHIWVDRQIVAEALGNQKLLIDLALRSSGIQFAQIIELDINTPPIVTSNYSIEYYAPENSNSEFTVIEPGGAKGPEEFTREMIHERESKSL